MTLLATPAVWLLLASTAWHPEPQAQPDMAVKDELKRLQGSWEIEYLEQNGEKLSADELKGRSILFGKDAFFMRRENTMFQMGMLKLDPGKSPTTVNAMVMQGQGKGDVMLGIYALDGDTLKLCFDADGQARPKEFKTEPKSGHMYMVCKRVRAKGEDQELVGSYRSETVQLDGTKHKSDVIIERVGDAYLVTYKTNNAVSFVGVGLRRGDVFCVSWLSQGQVGIAMYHIEKGPRLVGQFTVLGGPGAMGQEIITRMLKDV